MTLLSVIVASASAQDWPQWRGPNRDGKTTGFAAPASWPAALTKKWDIPVGSGVSNPSLVGDRLYLITREGESEVVRCLNATTGDEVWKDGYASAVPEGYGAGGGRFIGPRATPTVANGRVIALGANGMLSCYDAASGQLKWRKDEFVGQVPGFYASSSPIVVDGLCIVQLGAGLGEGARPGDVLGSMYAYDLMIGEEKWRAAEVSPTYGSPMPMTVDGMKVVFAVSESKLTGVNAANGKIVWTIPYRQGRYNAASPVVDGQTLILSGPGEGRGLTAFKFTRQGDELKEEEVWKNDDNKVLFNTPVLKDGAIYGLSTQDQIFAVNAQHATGWSAPIVPTRAAGAQLFPPDGQAVFAQVPQPEGERKQGEGARGQEQRRGRGQRRGGRQRPAGGGERPGYGSVVDAGSVMLALCPGADLVVFAPNAETYTELARYKVSEDGDVYSHPIVSGNRIYIKDRDSVAMFTVE
jgi:outer membrane protein assembly factor BamB